jgi:hypothetical protein
MSDLDLPLVLLFTGIVVVVVLLALRYAPPPRSW